MKKIRLALLITIIVSTILGSAIIIGMLRPASAPPAPAPSTTFEYRAKWVCNSPINATNTPIDTTAAEKIGMVPGEYKTDLNVHNPSHTISLNILKKFVVSQPEAPSVNSTRVAFASTVLRPDGAFFIDCSDIFNTFFQKAGIVLCPNFNTTCAFKGFVIINQLSSPPSTGTGFSSPNSLDVVGEYSSESFAPAPTTTAPTNCLIYGSFFPCTNTGLSLEVVPIGANQFVA